ncbi:MAG: methyltransferase domain-containing protein [Thermodesulfobacteriota bacterium]
MGKILDSLLVRDKHVCPWWCCFTFDNPVRKLLQDPVAILSPHVREGDLAVDIGAGMGYFSLPLCGLVGKTGRVIAVDLQERMLGSLRKRAARRGVGTNLETRLCTQQGLGIVAKADFVLAFWMVHEVPDQRAFLGEVHGILNPGGRFLVAEPRIHVKETSFEETVRTAQDIGFIILARPVVSLSRSVLLTVSA